MTQHHYATREAIEAEFAHSPSIAVLRHFAYSPTASTAHISEACNRLAMGMALSLPDGAEKTSGLRKLLEAKDCFIRAEMDRPE